MAFKFIKKLFLKVYPVFKRDEYPTIKVAEDIPKVNSFEVNFAEEVIEVVKLEEYNRVVNSLKELINKGENKQ